MANISREHFARRLWSLYDHFDDRDFNVENFSQKIMNAFLMFGSETPDNKQCFETIEYWTTTPRENPYVTSYEFKLKSKPIMVYELLHELEGMPFPEKIKEYYPDLTQDEWDAAMRMAVMVLLAFSPAKRKE